MPRATHLPNINPIDGAMKELMDMIKQSDETLTQPADHNYDKDLSGELNNTNEQSIALARIGDNLRKLGGYVSSKSSSSTARREASLHVSSGDGNETIENLRQRQCELQAHLDEALKVAKELELKQKRKLSGLIQDNMPVSTNKTDDMDDDIELIEFHQIEIELRISELNRQLSNIQEEMRLRLYRRLQSKTTGVHHHQPHNGQDNSHSSNRDSSLRRNSAQTDESTPPSSSCSDETSATSHTDTMMNVSPRAEESAGDAKYDKCEMPRSSKSCFRQDPPHSTRSDINFNDAIDSGLDRQADSSVAQGFKVQVEKNDLKRVLEQTQEMNNSSGGNAHLDTDDATYKTPSRIPTVNNTSKRTQNDYGTRCGENTASSNGYRNFPTANDLERIEEAEEEEAGYYCNSDKFRSIYDEKNSLMLKATESDNPRRLRDQQKHNDHSEAHASKKQSSNATDLFPNSYDELTASIQATPKPSQDNRFNINNVNSSKRGNRPLTIYMPRPDENIDLIETVQALGHDLDILSTDLKITPTSAQGYLYKSCSSNPKKWLKRYFYFNREAKVLSYHDSEEQLAKKGESPKRIIPFDEISDVYVDHRMSEKQKGATRKGYVFVLATIKRKYILASSKAETMRAWIDILFTAAKANDLFQQIDNDDEELSFMYESFKED